MKIKELLESHYNTYKIRGFSSKKDKLVEVFVNPNLKELNDITDNYYKYSPFKSHVRFAIIGKKLYVWDYNILHHTVLKKMRKNVYDTSLHKILTGELKRINGKWNFLGSDQIEVSIINIRDKEEKEYLKSIVNKDYKWVDKYISFTPKWNEYKKQIEKVLK